VPVVPPLLGRVVDKWVVWFDVTGQFPFPVTKLSPLWFATITSGGGTMLQCAYSNDVNRPGREFG
jgi:hypothetical protein